jgi:hypothetical protein
MGESKKQETATTPPPLDIRDDRAWRAWLAAPEQQERIRQAQEETAAKNVAQEATERTRQTEERLARLVIRYAVFSDYNSPEFLEQFARKNAPDLLTTREAIMREYMDLHTPVEFGALVRDREPVTYERATFRARALALAEQLMLKPGTVDHQDDAASEKLALAEAHLRHRFVSIPEILAKYPDLPPDELAEAEAMLAEALQKK